MRKLKIYIDTSVLGGYFDNEFEQESKQLFNEILSGKYHLVISDLTKKELLNAPNEVKMLLKNLSIEFELIRVNQESISLANEYIKEKVVGKTSIDDCIHISSATVNKIDILVSWNFKHIVNIQRIRGYNSINIKNGYAILEIRSPKDLIDYEDE